MARVQDAALFFAQWPIHWQAPQPLALPLLRICAKFASLRPHFRQAALDGLSSAKPIILHQMVGSLALNPPHETKGPQVHKRHLSSQGSSKRHLDRRGSH